MKEIKYKAWDEYEKYMWDWDTIVSCIDNQQLLLRGLLNGTNGLTLLQFTGLYDKNKKEIYEDYILLDRGNECQGIVRYSNIDGMFAFYTIDNEVYDFADIDSADFEVIGNIYENPELL